MAPSTHAPAAPLPTDALDDPEAAAPPPPVPRPGDLVDLRDRRHRVRLVTPSLHVPDQPPRHLVTLEPVDASGPPIAIIWELEPAITLHHDALAWPPITRLASPDQLAAGLDAAALDRSSPFLSTPLLAHRRSAVTPGPWQLVPAARAARMPRVSLLLADDTGLGKTLQAALVIRELLARQRIRRVLILTPASLQSQWQHELQRLVGLEATIIDRDAIRRLRQEHGRHLNPWTCANRLITSIDFLKREDVLHRFLAAIPRNSPDPSPWDLLVVDEAHNVAPPHQGPDSERSRMVRQLAGLFPHRLFLTATPHNGHRDSFVGLLELLDPLRFRRGRPPEPRHLQSVLVRRTRADVRDQLNACDATGDTLVIPERRVHAIPITLEPPERDVHDALDRWLDAARTARPAHPGIPLVGTILKKALLSSIPALDQVFSTHIASLASATPPASPNRQRDFDPAWFEPEDPEPALAAILATLPPLPDALRHAAAELASALQVWRLTRVEAKRHALLTLLDQLSETCAAPAGRACKLLVFTESRVTLHELKDLLQRRLGPEALVVLHGEVEPEQRRCRLTAFRRRQAGPRVLLATDAASEGLDIQQACHHLLHYDIPWNPSRLEQRNGRIDRLGQPDPGVHCHHFVARDHHDSRLLDLALRKIDRAREDLGSFSRVLALQLEDRLLRRHSEPDSADAVPAVRPPIEAPLCASELAGRPPALLRSDETPKDTLDDTLNDTLDDTLDDTLESVRRILARDRDDAPVTAARLRRIINEALALDGAPPLERRGQAWLLRRLPPSWRRPERPATDRLLRFPHGPRHDRAATLHLAHPLVRTAIHRLRSASPRAAPARVAIALGPRRQVFVALRRVWTNAEGHRLLESGLTLAGTPRDDPGAAHFRDLTWRTWRSDPDQVIGDLRLPPSCRLQTPESSPAVDPAEPTAIEHRIARESLARELRRRARLEQTRSRARLQALDRSLARRRLHELADHARELKRRLDLLDSRQDPSQLLLWSELERRELNLHTSCLSARRDAILQLLRRDDAARQRLELHPFAGVRFEVLAVVHVCQEPS